MLGNTNVTGYGGQAHQMSDIDAYTRNISDTAGFVLVGILIIFILLVKYAYPIRKNGE
jgi:hypothetical protein